MKKFFSENIGLKLFALFFACLLEYYFYSPDNSVSEVLGAKVHFHDLPDDQMIVDPQVGQKGIRVRVKVNGPSPLVEQLRVSQLNFNISVPKGVGERFSTRLDAAQINLPAGVSIVEILPESVDVRLGKVIKKALRVKVRSVGDPKKGFKLTGIKVKPPTVFASGPAGELEKLTEVQTQVLDVQGLAESGRKEVRLEEVGALTNLALNVVSINYSIEPVVRKRAFERIPIKLLLADGLNGKLEQDFASIVLTGPIFRLDSLAAAEVKLIADGSNLPVGEHRLKLIPKLPEGFRMVAASPGEIKVVISK